MHFHKVLDVFDLLDTSGDHRLSLDEFQEGVRMLGFNVSHEDAEKEFRRLDDNNSGSLSLDEFSQFVAERGVSLNL